MGQSRVRLGELLVEARIITREQLDEALALQRKEGKRLGMLLVEAGFVSETQVTQILSQQLSVPWVSLYHIDFSRQLLDLVPQAYAEKYCLVPIFVRRVRGVGDTLYVAMDDPTDSNARDEVAQYAGLPVRAMIACPSDIRSAIRVYYGVTSIPPSAIPRERGETGKVGVELPDAASTGDRVSGVIPVHPPPSSVSEAEDLTIHAQEEEATEPLAVESVSTESSPAEASVPDRDSEPPESGPQIEAREVSMPAPRKGPKSKMVTLTLLDGTKINLPARDARASNTVPSAEEKLTANDLVAALRAVASGADGNEVLGQNPQWERMFAALLSLLLKKHLIADWEFIEEYTKK